MKAKDFQLLHQDEQLEIIVDLSWRQMTHSTDSTLFTLLHIGILEHGEAQKLRVELAKASRYTPIIKVKDISLREAWTVTRQMLLDTYMPRVERIIKKEHVCALIRTLLQEQVDSSDAYNRKWNRFEIYLRDAKVQRTRQFITVVMITLAGTIALWDGLVNPPFSSMMWIAVLFLWIYFILEIRFRRPWINK
jgi:hypothetical protein